MNPFKGSAQRQPIIPPMAAMIVASTINDMAMLPELKPRARMAAISRDRSETAEYIVFSAARTAPIPITNAIMDPMVSIRVVNITDCFA